MAPTGQQQKWFASIKTNLEAETGRSFAEWVELAARGRDPEITLTMPSVDEADAGLADLLRQAWDKAG